jgi:Flp pilus assembly protein TadG
VLVALLIVVFLACVALTTDVGALMLRRRQMVNGADAAAHAAAVSYMRTGSTGAATGDANKLFGENAPAGGSLVSIQFSNPVTQLQGSVTVRYTADQALFFAPALGFSDTHVVSTTATATWKSDGGISGGVIHSINGSDLRVYTCKYIGKPPSQTLSLAASGWRNTNSAGKFGGGAWNGQTGFNDAQDSYVIASVPKTSDQYVINPATDCPKSGPHVWLSN